MSGICYFGHQSKKQEKKGQTKVGIHRDRTINEGKNSTGAYNLSSELPVQLDEMKQPPKFRHCPFLSVSEHIKVSSIPNATVLPMTPKILPSFA